MAATSGIFTGSSSFSNDFQQVIQRAVNIASLPLTQMQAGVTLLQSQSSGLTGLSSKFSSVQQAVSNLESALGLGSFAGMAADTDVASVALSGTPQAGGFSLEVIDVGVYSLSLSKDTGLTAVADPSQSSISDATSYTLKAGTEAFTITPGSNTLSALADAINRNSDAHVQATIVNTGPPDAPNYQLSIQGTRLGDHQILLQAIDGTNPGQELLEEHTAGDTATYRINGKPSVAIESDSRTITAAPGVSVTLLKAGTTDVTVSRSTASVSGALQAFVTAYNAAQSAIDSNRGSGDGALKGQSLLSTATDALRRVVGYSSGNSGISSLTALGLEFDTTGTLSFNQAKFSGATTGAIQQLTDFLGSPDTGGFLKAATDTLNTLIDSSTGVITASLNSVQKQISAENAAIASKQERIDLLENNLNSRMAAADAAIAALEQQYSYISNMFETMRAQNQNR